MIGNRSRLRTQFLPLDTADLQCTDSTSSKAHRCSAGGKGGRKIRPSAAVEADGPPKFMPSPAIPGV
jgi:hypothetical protein